VRPGLPHLADVVDGPDGDELTVRPNQIFDVSLPHPLIEGERAQVVLDVVGRDLLTSYGLRSLSPGDPPHLPRGCIAQAWGVAEVLRA
jgi:4-alpha-glucanotransferase